jgi:hypothetical protein
MRVRQVEPAVRGRCLAAGIERIDIALAARRQTLSEIPQHQQRAVAQHHERSVAIVRGAAVGSRIPPAAAMVAAFAEHGVAHHLAIVVDGNLE